MKFLLSTLSILFFCALMTSCEVDDLPDVPQEAELPDAWIQDVVCEDIVLWEGNFYDVGAIIDYTEDAVPDWRPNLSVWLSPTTDVHVDTSPAGTHVYSGWLIPSDPHAIYITAVTFDTVEGPQSMNSTSNSNQLYINPSFWDYDEDPNQPWIRPFGTYNVIAIADTKLTLREQQEGQHNVKAFPVEVIANPL